MKDTILIQFSIAPNRLASIVQACNQCAIDYQFFSYYRESQKIDDLPPDIINGNFFTFCNIQPMLYALKRQKSYYKNPEDHDKYNNSFIDSFYGDTFDGFEQEFIFNAIEKKEIAPLPMLNADSRIVDLQSIDDNYIFKQPLFIKPNSAFKPFIGGVTNIGESFKDFLTRKQIGSNKDIKIMMSPVKNIHSEYRFFVYNGLVVGQSSYIQQHQFNTSAPVPQQVLSQAHRIAMQYQPAPSFTLDLCLLDNGEVLIVEYNHISASGNYNCDVSNLIKNICSDKKQFNKGIK